MKTIGPDNWEGYKALRGCQAARAYALAPAGATSENPDHKLASCHRHPGHRGVLDRCRLVGPGLGNLLARAIIASPRIQPRSVDAHLIRVATRTMSLAILFVIVLTRLRERVVSHQRILEADSCVRFRRFGDYSLDVEFFAYANAGGWLEDLAIREDVLLHVMRILEDAGVSIAFPSQTTYLGRDTASEPAAREAATAEVRRWIETGRLPFPDLPDAEAERLRGTVEYPPAPFRSPDDGREGQ